MRITWRFTLHSEYVFQIHSKKIAGQKICMQNENENWFLCLSRRTVGPDGITGQVIKNIQISENMQI